jgi:hypothetical protein
MFDAVNSIERRYRPYLVQLPANAATSKEAAAAAAAATVLATIDANTATQMKEVLASYLASLPDGSAKAEGSSSARLLPQKSWQRGLTMAATPPILPARDNTWRLCADADHARADVAQREAVRNGASIPVPARSAGCAR